MALEFKVNLEDWRSILSTYDQDDDYCLHGNEKPSLCKFCNPDLVPCFHTKFSNSYHFKKDCEALSDSQTKAERNGKTAHSIESNYVHMVNGRLEPCNICVHGRKWHY